MSKKKIKSKMTYSESELDSNFAINSVSDFDSASDYELTGFLSIFMKESTVMQAMQV